MRSLPTEDPQTIPGYKNAFFMFHEAEQNHGEYDVVQCPKGTPPSECVHEVVGQFPLSEAMHECTDPADVWCGAGTNTGFVEFVHISLHCHGPACISVDMINADTNETICHATPVYRTGDEPLNEAGYAAGILRCIWGTKEEGLRAPPVLSLATEAANRDLRRKENREKKAREAAVKAPAKVPKAPW